MRKSPLRTTVAVLRNEIGLPMKAFAAMVDVNPGTLQAIELGRRPLAEDVARKIARATFVSLDWLMAGDPDAPIIKGSGSSYSKDVFEAAQEHRSFPLNDVARTVLFGNLSCLLEELIWHGAKTFGDLDEIKYEMNSASRRLGERFGISNRVDRHIGGRASGGALTPGDIKRLQRSVERVVNLQYGTKFDREHEEWAFITLVPQPEFKDAPGMASLLAKVFALADPTEKQQRETLMKALPGIGGALKREVFHDKKARGAMKELPEDAYVAWISGKDVGEKWRDDVERAVELEAERLVDVIYAKVRERKKRLDKKEHSLSDQLEMLAETMI